MDKQPGNEACFERDQEKENSSKIMVKELWIYKGN